MSEKEFQLDACPFAGAGHYIAETPEVLFIDPSVSDLNTIIQNRRPEVEAIVLDASRPASRQMAEALHDRHSLAAGNEVDIGQALGGEWKLTIRRGRSAATADQGGHDELRSRVCNYGD